MHLDSLASTVVQRCIYWGTHEQCHFCAIELTRGEQTRPGQDAGAAGRGVHRGARLDGAKDVTLTTGSPNRRDRGALYIARCAAAISESSGLPVQVQFEPPDDFAWSAEVHDAGVEALGLHLETFDPEVLARVAPGKPAVRREGYFRGLGGGRRRVRPRQVSTYFILGLGERPEPVIEEGCRRAIDGASTRSSCRCGRRRARSWPTARRPPPTTCRRSTSGWRRCWPSAGLTTRTPGPAARAARPARRFGRWSACSEARSGVTAAIGAVEHARLGPSLPPGAGGRARDDLAAHFAVRREVFVREQALFAATTATRWDDDGHACTSIAWRRARVVGAVRLYPLDEAGLWKGDRLAVLPEARARPARRRCSCASPSRPPGAMAATRMVAHDPGPERALLRATSGWARTATLAPYHGVMHQPMDIDLRSFNPRAR